MTEIDNRLGAAIKRHRLARGLSFRKAADAAGMSEGRWRQIELGYQQVASGVRVPAKPKAMTVASMAVVVGMDVDEALVLAGHEPVGAAPQDGAFVTLPGTETDPDERPVTTRQLREEMDRVHGEISAIRQDIREALGGGDT